MCDKELNQGLKSIKDIFEKVSYFVLAEHKKVRICNVHKENVLTNLINQTHSICICIHLWVNDLLSQ